MINRFIAPKRRSAMRDRNKSCRSTKAVSRCPPISTASCDGELRMEWLQDLSDSATQYGALAFLLLYLVVATLPMPRWPLTVAAGAAFGFVKGVAIALIVSFLGASCAFLASRYLFRQGVQKMIK